MGERTRELLVLIIGDIIVFNVALLLTLTLRYLEFPDFERLMLHIPPFLTFSAVWLFVFFILGLYDKHTSLLKRLLLSRILYAQSINVIVAGVLFFVLPLGITPKTNLVLYLLISIGLLTWWRLRIVPALSPTRRHRAIMLASGEAAVELVDEINNNDRYNYYFVRLIDDAAISNTPDFESKILALMEREHIEVIVADPKGTSAASFLPVLFDLSFLRFRCTFLDFNRLYEDTFDRVPVGMIQYEWFISNISQSKTAMYDAIKRVIDIVGSLLLLIPAALVFPFVAAAIKLEDKGPLLYSTMRVGQFNQPIKIFKFRTKNGADSGDQALKSTLVDTKVGTFLRRTRIDELPQLLNVLRGDLSFIGPRPEIPELANVYAEEITYYNTRHLLKPGLSGWAQINNYDVPRGGIDVEKTVAKLSYDLFYLQRRSILLDIHIALKTIATLVMRTGS
jgi:lipopolysaccharide/colanic/teichoic acid biosynthesis glycosyltransferase